MKHVFARFGALVVSGARLGTRGARLGFLALVALARRLVRARLTRLAWRATLRTARVGALAAFVAGCALGAGWLCFHRVPPGTIGVQQVNFGGAGIVPRDFPSGLHFSLRGWHSWHAVDARTQHLAFSWSAEPCDAEYLKVRTADGNYVRVGLAVPFRVRAGEAHLLVEQGLKSTYRQRVMNTVEKVLTSEFARLRTEEYADTTKRLELVARALPLLNADLAALHVEATDVLIEHFRFNNEYENRQQQVQYDALKEVVSRTTEANLAEQALIDQTLRDIAEDEAQLSIELTREIERAYHAGRKGIEARLAEARYYDQTRRAEGEAEFQRLVAAGERELAQAEALWTTAENESFATRGGRVLLARAAARNLNVDKVTLNSNDPRQPSLLDLDGLVRLFVGRDPAPEPKQP